MNVRQLRTFVTIADAGGFARAQGRLHLSQPAASRQIQALEDEFGIRLFDRIGRGIQLTPEGEDLLRRSRRLLQEFESLGDRVQALKGGQAGTLRVGGSTQHIESVLAGFLPHFRRLYPAVEVDLVEDGGARIPSRLERGDVQLALMTAEDESYPGHVLAPVHVLAVVSPSHPLAGRPTLDITELTNEPLLLLRREFASRGWFETACHVAHLRPRVILESAAPHTLMALVGANYGVAIVPSNAHIPRRNVHAMPLLHRRQSIGRWAIVAWDPQRFLPPYAERFADRLAAYCKRSYPGRLFAQRAPPLPSPKIRPS